MRLFVVSDIHGSIARVRDAAEHFRASDVTVVSGDFAKAGKEGFAKEVLDLMETYAGRIIAVPGNWDRHDFHALLDDRGYSVHGRGRDLDGIGFFGAGGSTKSIIKTPTQYGEEEIYRLLEKAYAEVADLPHRVMVTHVPPRDACDRALLFLKGGSRAVRSFIESHEVELCISGHIHESQGTAVLDGRCAVVNPGSLKNGRYAEVEIGTSITIRTGRLGR